MTSIYYLFVLLSIVSCTPLVNSQLTPEIQSPAPDTLMLSKAFAPFFADEPSQDWTKEYTIGLAFAKQRDYYRAITSFQRALILSPSERNDVQEMLSYYLFLCYYFGYKYEAAVSIFEHTALGNVSPKTFPFFQDLLILLQECYHQTNRDTKEAEEKLQQLLLKSTPKVASKLSLSHAIRDGNIPEVIEIAEKDPKLIYIPTLMHNYKKESKSIKKAQYLNAILPGAGYYYIGQKNTAVTAFLINALFIAGAAVAFDKGNPALGTILSSLELGWYLGGIYGVGLATQTYNSHLYRKYGDKILLQERLFPLFMLEYKF